MLSIAFLDHGKLVRAEILSALNRLPGTQVIALKLPLITDPSQAERVCREVDTRGCRLVLTLNNWGLDRDGVLRDFMCRKGIAHANWFVDDPFYMEVVHGILYSHAPNRLDFTTDRACVQPLLDRGYKAFFLPIATDPAIFRIQEPAPIVYPVGFVGESYIKLEEEMTAWCEMCSPGTLALCDKKIGMEEPQHIDDKVKRIISSFTHLYPAQTPGLEYRIKHILGIRYRRSIIRTLSEHYADFALFGDRGWESVVQKMLIRGAVDYSAQLSTIYQRTAVNIDINRLFIKDGLTQRVFDSLASGACVVTSHKPVVHELFETSGPNSELCVFDNKDSLLNCVDFLLSHPISRHSLAQRGREAVLARHTYDHRIAQILHTVRDSLPQ